ncbi:hypothetical protein PSAC2689_80029 [Paraburkholderia sacchari]
MKPPSAQPCKRGLRMTQERLRQRRRVPLRVSRHIERHLQLRHEALHHHTRARARGRERVDERDAHSRLHQRHERLREIRFHASQTRYATLREQAVDAQTRMRSRRIGNEVLAFAVGGANRALACEAVAARHDAAHRPLPETLETHRARRRFLANERQVAALRRHAFERERGFERDQRDVHARMLLRERRAHARQKVGAEFGRACHAQHAATLLADLRGGLHDTLEPTERTLDFRMQGMRLARRQEPPACTFEQCEAYARLEVGNETAYRGLRNAERVRRARDRAPLHQGAKRFNLANTEFGNWHNIHACYFL